jgi:glyoxylase-like metal-dependent hydrolase (beta-lactamase superfamily II)
LGSRDVPIYLLRAERPVLFDAGIVKLGRIYEEAIRTILGKVSPAMLLLTHMHFDHCGTVSYLKTVFPNMKVGASKEAGEIIKRPNAIKLIQTLSENATEALAALDESKLLNEPFEPFDVDMVLEDGDVIELEDGLTVHVVSAPGHTGDFLSYYIPERKVLIASEAGGCAEYSGYIHTACLNDFGVYLSSLKRLASLEVDILCQGHRFVYSGEDAKTFLSRSMKTALDFKAMVQEFWENEHEDLPRVMARIRGIEFDPLPLPKQPEPAYLANLEARVKSIVAYLGLEKASPP